MFSKMALTARSVLIQLYLLLAIVQQSRSRNFHYSFRVWSLGIA